MSFGLLLRGLSRRRGHDNAHTSVLRRSRPQARCYPAHYPSVRRRATNPRSSCTVNALLVRVVCELGHGFVRTATIYIYTCVQTSVERNSSAQSSTPLRIVHHQHDKFIGWLVPLTPASYCNPSHLLRLATQGVLTASRDGQHKNS